MRCYFYAATIIYTLSNTLARKGAEKCGDIFLTVSAAQLQLEFNWNFTNCDNPPDSLSLLHEEDGCKTELQTIDVDGVLAGSKRSTIKFTIKGYPGNWNYDDKNRTLGSLCYPYSITSRRRKCLVDSSCLKIEPAWMQRFGKLKIADMMLPGTHNSGAFTTPVWYFLHARYIITQNHDLWGQLVSGIRYLDIRVSVFDQEVWITHAGYQCTNMKAELQKISRFLEASPKEVVILHIKAYEKPELFTCEHHQVVLNLLQAILGNHILPRSNFIDIQDLTIEDIWMNNKRLIISYHDGYIVEENPWLWNGVSHKWGNKQDVTGLHEYLDLVKSDHDHPSAPFCSLMAQLTADYDYVIQNPFRTVGLMADEVNPQLNLWLRSYSWSSTVNIVATDFFQGNDVISISIESNKMRLLNINNTNNKI